MEAKFHYQFERATPSPIHHKMMLQDSERRPRDNIQIMETYQSRTIRDS